MKRNLLLPALAFSTVGAFAQLPPNSVAPDFTANDINGQSHHLYEYLDQGYTVIMDISAAWCGPCWSYHNSGALENLYETYGPGTAQDKVMVLFIEGEGANTGAQITGTTTNQQTSGFSQGDWTEGTPYPIIDNAQIADDYAITYFPTIYQICPNRVVNEVGQLSTAQLWNGIQDCPAASVGTNAALLAYTGTTVVCDEVEASVTLQNMGTANLTSATITLKENGNVISTQDWSGDLATYSLADVTLPSAAVTDPAAVTVEVATNDDANSADNSLDPGLTSAVSADQQVTLTLLLDNYCAETTWKLFNGAGTVVQQGGPYNCTQNGTGADANATKTYNWTLPLDCYRFEIYDAYGDGLMAAQWGGTNGDYNISDSNGQIINGNPDYDNGTMNGIDVNTLTGISENALNNSLNVYPNPNNGTLFLSYGLTSAARVNVEVFNSLGELVLANTNTVPAGVQVRQLDLSGLNNGVYFLNINADGVKASRTITLNK